MLPCEKMVKYYIPALRVAVAKDLSKKGKTQIEIARALGITQAAVNKYLSGNYSAEIKKVERDKNVKILAQSITDRIASHGIEKADTHRLMMESCATLSGCGIKHV